MKHIFNNKGLTIMESLIAVMLSGVAIIGLLSMQPLSLQSAAKADSISVATELMQRELEMAENSIMSMAEVTPPADKVNVQSTVNNKIFTINVRTTRRDTVTWLVRVNVTWPGSTRGVFSSIIVSRQDAFTI